MERKKGMIFDDRFSGLITHCFNISYPDGDCEIYNSRFIHGASVFGDTLNFYCSEDLSLDFKFSDKNKAHEALAVIIASFPTHFLPDDKD
jgi:hypothetical protein